MKIKKASDSGLLMLHQAVANALTIDDNLPKGQEIHGVREEPDWKIWSDQLEEEMTVRNMVFHKINWKTLASD